MTVSAKLLNRDNVSQPRRNRPDAVAVPAAVAVAAHAAPHVIGGGSG